VTNSSGPRERLDEALSTLTVEGDWSRARLMEQKNAAAEVESVAREHPSVAAERTTDICTAFDISLEGDRGTDAHGTDHSRPEAIEAAGRSLAGAVAQLAETDAAEPVVDAVVDGLESHDDAVVETAAVAAEPLLDAGHDGDERLISALVTAHGTADDSNARAEAAKRLAAVLETDQEALVPHVAAVVDATTHSFVRSETAELLALLAEAVPDALAEHADRMANHVETLVDVRRVSDQKMVSILAPIAVALYSVAQADRTAVTDQVETIAWFAALDPDDDRAHRGAKALADVARAHPDAAADASVVEAAVTFVENTVEDATALDPDDVAVDPTLEGWNTAGDLAAADSRTAGVETILSVLRKIADHDPEPLAEHLKSLLSAVERADPVADGDAARVTRAVAEVDPSAVADAGPAVGDLVGRAEREAVARDWFRALLAGAGETTLPQSVADGVAAAVRRHDVSAIRRDGLAVLTAVDRSPGVSARQLDAVLAGLEALDDDAEAADGSAADALAMVADACRADPGSVSDHADAVVAAATDHASDARSKTVTAILTAVAEVDPAAVAGETGRIADAITAGTPEIRNRSLAATHAVATEHPDALVDHVPAVLTGLRAVADEATDGSSPSNTTRAADAFAVLVRVSAERRGVADHAETVATALADLPDTASALDDALSDVSLRTTSARQFVLAVLESVLEAIPDGEDSDPNADLGAARRTAETVRMWADRVDDRSTDAVVATDATMLRLESKEHAEKLADAAPDVRGDPQGNSGLRSVVDRLADDSGSAFPTADDDVVMHSLQEFLGDEPRMEFEAALRTISETSPDGSASALERRTGAAASVAAGARETPGAAAEYVDEIAALLRDAEVGAEDAVRRTVFGATALQVAGYVDPESVAPHTETLVALLDDEFDTRVRAAALAVLARVALDQPNLAAEAFASAERAARASDTAESDADLAAVGTAAALAAGDTATVVDRAGTLARLAADHDRRVADLALEHLQQVAANRPDVVVDHLDEIAAALRTAEYEGSVADRALTVLGHVTLGDATDAVASVRAVVRTLDRVDSDRTAAWVAVLILADIVEDTPSAVVEVEGVAAEDVATATADVLRSAAIADVADAATVVLGILSSRVPTAVLAHVDALVATRERFHGHKSAERAVVVLAEAINAEPTAGADHLGTLLEWLDALEPDGHRTRQFVETGIRTTVSVVQQAPAALRPHVGDLVRIADDAGIARDAALTVGFLAVRGDLKTAGDAIESVVPALERAGHEGLLHGASMVMVAAVNTDVPPTVARRTGQAVAGAEDPIGVVDGVLEVLPDDRSALATFVRILDGLGTASDDPVVTLRCNVELSRVLMKYSAAGTTTAGAACDCLGSVGGRNTDGRTEFRLFGDD